MTDRLNGTGRLVAHGALGLFWACAVPLLFLTLYATAQLQTAANAALRDAPAVPNIAVISHSKAVGLVNSQIKATAQRSDYNAAAYAADNRAYTLAKHRLRIQLFAIAGGDSQDQRLLECASRDGTIGCFERVMVAAHQRLATMNPSGAGQLASRLAAADETFLQFLTLSTTTQELKRKITQENKRLDELRVQYQSLSLGEGARLHAVASTFDELDRNIPWFRAFFMLPDGAVIGLFASVMGAIGAVVFSLFGRMKSMEAEGSLSSEPILRSYVTRPLLGALAGFIVYFVVSAGSGVLLEANSAAKVEAGGGLSTAALATLGLFAGLAAENAMQWVTEKARGLFKSQP